MVKVVIRGIVDHGILLMIIFGRESLLHSSRPVRCALVFKGEAAPLTSLKGLRVQDIILSLFASGLRAQYCLPSGLRAQASHPQAFRFAQSLPLRWRLWVLPAISRGWLGPSDETACCTSGRALRRISYTGPVGKLCV